VGRFFNKLAPLGVISTYSQVDSFVV